MTCVEVRDRLTEHALGLLPEGDGAEVERHLDWCAGCRKEAVELQDAVATVGFALPPADPARRLQDRIVGSVGRDAAASAQTSRGKDARVGRPGIRALAAATLAAVLVAMGALGWAVAEQQTAQDVRATAAKSLQNIRKLDDLLSLGGQSFHAQLLPTSRFEGNGFAVIVSSQATNNFVFVDVLPPTPDTGPFAVQIVDRSGRVLSVGDLSKSDSGDLLLYAYMPQDLSKAITVSILDRSSNVVMSGTVSPYSGS
jgi:hypothetical protein